MKVEELRKKDTAELHKHVVEARQKLADLRFKAAANQVKNTKEMGSLKKEIARMMTIVQEKKGGK